MLELQDRSDPPNSTLVSEDGVPTVVTTLPLGSVVKHYIRDFVNKVHEKVTESADGYPPISYRIKIFKDGNHICHSVEILT